MQKEIMTGNMNDMKLTGSILQCVETGISPVFINTTFIWLFLALAYWISWAIEQAMAFK